MELPINKIAATKSGGNIMRKAVLIIACLILGGLLFAVYSPFIVGSSSMEPNYPAFSLIIVKKSGFNSLKVGDVIAYRADALGGNIALHRIIRTENGGFYTKGDANENDDRQLVLKDDYVGKAVYTFKFFAGYLSKVQTRKGLILFFILPVLLILLIYFSYGLIKGTSEKREGRK